MNILVFGPDRLMPRIRDQKVGASWDLFRAKSAEEIWDFFGTHEFQAAVMGVCSNDPEALQCIRLAKEVLRVPVVIALASAHEAATFGGHLPVGADVVLIDCGEDRLTKLQCDALVRFANQVAVEDISSGDVTFHMSRNTFSVKGQDIHLPRKQHQLLELLFLKQGRTVTTEMVFNQLYGWEKPPSSKIVDVFICQIRRKLREAGSERNCIQTIWGQGYSLGKNVPELIKKAA